MTVVSPYRTPARTLPVAQPISARATWIGAIAFAATSALSISPRFRASELDAALTIAMVATAFAAFAWPVAETRARLAAGATAVGAMGVWFFPGVETLTVGAAAACAWLAFELRRPLGGSPWPGLAAAALAMAAPWPWVVPAAFACLFAASARLLSRAAPALKLPAYRRDLELVGAAFLVVATIAAGGASVAVAGAIAVLAVAMLRNAQSLVFPMHIAIHGAFVAQVIASFGAEARTVGFASGCAVALVAIAITGIGMFLPTNAPPKVGLTLAGFFLCCAGFMRTAPFPIPLLQFMACVPSVVLVAIALKQQTNQK